ncbi:hypothetical protein SS50377_26690 [Spironucleus salmonicida]|uniref:Uncharacterized protein n=1 Tax=Spironucleus salmonicida TaxID=348837 RepID=V6M6Y3_9EUKA|nr:hypothetical protein SS50377_26690 [Spironucleus salmonicida]|eukprot:EST49164.1 Hypothetical protein SS50377_10377 [Spironucleus salmonicida]
MKIQVYSVDQEILSPDQFDSLTPTSNILINDYIYFKILFSLHTDVKSIVLTIQSDSHSSQPYTLNPIFNSGQADFYKLEFQQHDPLPGKIFQGFFIITNFSNDLILEKKIHISISSPIFLNLVSLENEILEFQMKSQKSLQIISFIMQSGNITQSHNSINDQNFDINLTHRDFVSLNTQFYNQISEKITDFTITVIYRFNNQLNNLKFGFDLSEFFQKMNSKKQANLLQISAQISSQIPNSHNDLSKNKAYFIVQLKVKNTSPLDMQNIQIKIFDIPHKVQAITQLINIPIIPANSTTTQYIELYTYLTTFILPKIRLKSNQIEHFYDEIVLFK